MLNKHLQYLQDIVKINLNENLNLNKILEYIEIIKSYENITTKPYCCEWLDPIKLDIFDFNFNEIIKEKEDLIPGQKVGNIQTYNYKKVPKVI